MSSCLCDSASCIAHLDPEPGHPQCNVMLKEPVLMEEVTLPLIATLNLISNNLQWFLQSQVLHLAFLGKCQPERVVFDLLELWLNSYAIPVLLECVPNLSFNRFKQNAGAMLDFLCMSQIWRSFVWYITHCYLDSLLTQGPHTMVQHEQCHWFSTTQSQEFSMQSQPCKDSPSTLRQTEMMQKLQKRSQLSQLFTDSETSQ